MKRFTITIISAMLCGLVVLSACGGAKKNVQDAEGQAEAGNLYATNKVQPPIPVLYRIAEILNVDVRTLLVPNEIKK